VISVLVHMALVAAAHLAALGLRFDGNIPPAYWNVAAVMLPFVVIVRTIVFYPFRIFDGLWRYTSLWDVRNIALGVAASTGILYPLASALAPAPGYPPSIYLLDALVLVLLVASVRMLPRLPFGRRARGRRVLVYGAGDAGEMIVRDMRQNPAYDAQPVGFIDDDVRKQHQRIHGVPVLGTRRSLARILEQTRAEEVLIAIPSAPASVLRDIVRDLCPYKVRISTLPPLAAIVSGQVGVHQIRDMKVDDLLARDPVTLDYLPVHKVLHGKRVLVTGAGGSIGAELCRQIAHAGPAVLLLLDRCENALVAIHNELAAAYPSLAVQAIVADITDATRVDQVVGLHRPQVVFHAAAHKHVPLMEQNPCEAIKNNVRGTRLVAEAACRWGAERFVLISTDKAVNPTSVMGAAKRVAELIVRTMDARSATRFVAVRFGNVLGSSGSVVPLFLSQIARGGPVTVTHPEMRRYFMLIPEAVQLVLHAAALDDRGCIFVLDMGEQVRVADMARHLIRLSGHIPEQEIAITYTGVRPGEKLYEELVGANEHVEPSSIPKILKVNGEQPPKHRFDSLVAGLEQAAMDGVDEVVVDHLCRLVPTYTPTARVSALPTA
jgi:FlaA1/EpsC-like NDP-sugar epimerase